MLWECQVTKLLAINSRILYTSSTFTRVRDPRGKSPMLKCLQIVRSVHTQLQQRCKDKCSRASCATAISQPPTTFQMHKYISPCKQPAICQPVCFSNELCKWMSSVHAWQWAQRARNVLELVKSVRFIRQHNRALSLSSTVWQRRTGLSLCVQGILWAHVLILSIVCSEGICLNVFTTRKDVASCCPPLAYSK